MLCGISLCLAQKSGADRVVLSPGASALPPNGIKLETALSPYRKNENLSWFQFSTPEGVEIEAQRFDLASDIRDRYSLSAQYPLLSDLGAIPAVSLGVRDILGTGVERTAVYFSVGKSLALSDRQLRYVREFKWSLGLGTGRLGGLFAGIETRLRGGISLYAEVYRHRPNAGVGLALVRNLQAKVLTLDGGVFYGLSYTLVR